MTCSRPRHFTSRLQGQASWLRIPWVATMSRRSSRVAVNETWAMTRASTPENHGRCMPHLGQRSGLLVMVEPLNPSGDTEKVGILPDTRNHPGTQAVVIRTGVKAGGATGNHTQTLAA